MLLQLEALTRAPGELFLASFFFCPCLLRFECLQFESLGLLLPALFLALLFLFLLPLRFDPLEQCV